MLYPSKKEMKLREEKFTDDVIVCLECHSHSSTASQCHHLTANSFLSFERLSGRKKERNLKRVPKNVHLKLFPDTHDQLDAL